MNQTLTAALACRRLCIPIVASTAALQAALLTAPGGSYFSSPLGVALSSYMEEPACRAALLAALGDLAASPGVQALAAPGAPDQQPETALVRNLLQVHASVKCWVALAARTCHLVCRGP